MQSPTTPDAKVKRASRRKPRDESSEAYDTWLDHRLKALYQPFLEAPLPPDILKLLRQRKP
jgi:hypothetical protein